MAKSTELAQALALRKQNPNMSVREAVAQTRTTTIPTPPVTTVAPTPTAPTPPLTPTQTIQ